MHKHQTGMGLLEIMLALAIIALLLLGAVKYYRSVRIGASSDELAKKVLNIAAASERFSAAHQGSFEGIYTMDNLIEQGLLTKDFFKNEWGGDIGVHALSANSIQISIHNLPSDVCYHVGSKLGIKAADLDSQCEPGAKDSGRTLLYCYPDQKTCPSSQ